MNHVARSTVFVLALLVSTICRRPGTLEAREPITPERVAVLLEARDWRSLAAEIESREGRIESPVERALLGHACLALNRNEDSLCAFLLIFGDADTRGWLAWADAFAAQRPHLALASYFKGDALARRSDWNGAVSAYDQAIALDEKLALAFNARGVARVRQGKDREALKDFQQAYKLDPSFADARASLAVFWLHRKGAKGALQAAEEALKQAPELTLARVSKGCAQFLDGDEAKARDTFAGAIKGCGAAFLARHNMAQVLAFESSILAGTDAKPGSTLTSSQLLSLTRSQIDRMSPAQRQSTLNQLDWGHKWNRGWEMAGNIVNSLGGKYGKAGEFQLLNVGWLETSRRNADIFANKQAMLSDFMSRRGENPFKSNPGGIRTEDLKDGFHDRSKFPVLAWFGLAQSTDLPSGVTREAFFSLSE